MPLPPFPDAALAREGSLGGADAAIPDAAWPNDTAPVLHQRAEVFADASLIRAGGDAAVAGAAERRRRALLGVHPSGGRGRERQQDVPPPHNLFIWDISVWNP